MGSVSSSALRGPVRTMQHWLTTDPPVASSSMRRRTLLNLGLGSAIVLAAVGGGMALLQPAIEAGRLTPRAHAVFLAVANAVLDGALPSQPEVRQRALAAHMQRLDATIAALPEATRAELSQLLALLASPAGRVTFAALRDPWDVADIRSVQSSLQSLRMSTLALRQQAYHALRDLTNAAFFSDPSAWSVLGYPGPQPI